jgi:hypothetical protein
MLTEPRTIPEHLMLELEEAIEKVNKMFAKVNAVNERNMTAEWREEDTAVEDYRESIRC